MFITLLCILAQEEAEESTEPDLMNIYGQSSELTDHTDELQCCSPANKRQCVNEVLSEIEQNVSCASNSTCSVQTSCNLDNESALSATTEPSLVSKSSPRRTNKENSPDLMPTAISADESSKRCGAEISESTFMKSPVRRKNIFAVNSNAGLRPRFSLNESKVKKNEINVTVEVKSRQV